MLRTRLRVVVMISQSGFVVARYPQVEGWPKQDCMFQRVQYGRDLGAWTGFLGG